MTLASNICLLFLVIASSGMASSLIDAPVDPKPIPWFNCSNVDPGNFECCNFVQYVYNNTVNASHHKADNNSLTNDAAIAILYSGHSPNDLGFYTLCQEQGDRNYFLMELTESSMNVPDGSFGFYFGLCLPQYCSLSYLQSESATITDRLQYLGIAYVKNLDAVFIDPSNYKIENDFYLVVAIIVFVLIGIMNILGTYLPHWAKVDQPAAPSLPPRPQGGSTGLNDSVSQRSDSFRGDSFISNDPRNPSIRMRTATYLKTHPKLLKTLECFNFTKNTKNFFKSEKDTRMDTSLNALDGVRTLSFIGIVYAHTFLNAAVSKNEFSTIQFGKEPGALLVLAAFFGVDIFLILSGFLQGFQLTSKLKKMPLTLKNYLLLIRHRYVRIIPAYFVAMLMYWKVGVHMGSGPLWYQYVDRAQQCTNAWWKSMFFLDNAMNTGSRFYCINWGWYLSCDFQVFLLAPFIIWIYLKKRSRGHNMIWVLLMISFVAGFIATTDVNFKYSFPPSQMQGNFWADFYSDTLVRMSSYLIGILIGTQYRVYKNGETNNIFGYCKKSKWFGYGIFSLGLFCTLFEIFFPRVVQTGTEWSDGFNFFWQVIDRPLLAGGIFLILIPGIVGLVKPLTWFLGNYLFILGSKLSFCGYLVQDIVILLFLRSETAFLGFSYGNKNMLAIGFIAVSLFVGAALHLLVEKPAGNMETAFLSIKLQEKPDQKSKIDPADESRSLAASKVQERRETDGNFSSPEKTQISPNRDLSPAIA